MLVSIELKYCLLGISCPILDYEDLYSKWLRRLITERSDYGMYVEGKLFIRSNSLASICIPNKYQKIFIVDTIDKNNRWIHVINKQNDTLKHSPLIVGSESGPDVDTSCAEKTQIAAIS